MNISWFAGLYEGEGSACWIRSRRKNPTIQLSIKSTDLDVLEKIQIPGGKITGPCWDNNPIHKPYWNWRIHKRKNVFDLIKLILPYMGKRRKDQLTLVLLELALMLNRTTP